MNGSLQAASGRYFEPFLGSGALFFHLRPARATLSDLNAELVNAYRQVCDRVDEVIEALRPLRHSQREYKKQRQLVPDGALERAVQFIYLNRTCWNGLYRVNRAGRFNVPIGRHRYPRVCDPEVLRAAGGALRGAKLLAGDFEDVLKDAREGDFVYLDPPYATAAHPRANGFIEYNSSLFALADQKRLAAVAHDLRRRGCLVLISNVDHPTIVSLFRGFRSTRISRSSTIAGIITDRGKVRERLFLNFALEDLGASNGSTA